MSAQQVKNKVLLEFISWIITAVIIYAVIAPLTENFKDNTFLYDNIFFIVIFLTYTRYLFLFKHTFIANLQILKIILICVSIPLVFYIIQELNAFQGFLDNDGLNSFKAYFLREMPVEKQENLLGYMKKEYIFFGVSSAIVALIMPFRLVVSIWRVFNKTGRV